MHQISLATQSSKPILAPLFLFFFMLFHGNHPTTNDSLFTGQGREREGGLFSCHQFTLFFPPLFLSFLFPVHSPREIEGIGIGVRVYLSCVSLVCSPAAQGPLISRLLLCSQPSLTRAARPPDTIIPFCRHVTDPLDSPPLCCYVTTGRRRGVIVLVVLVFLTGLGGQGFCLRFCLFVNTSVRRVF